MAYKQHSENHPSTPAYENSVLYFAVIISIDAEGEHHRDYYVGSTYGVKEVNDLVHRLGNRVNIRLRGAGDALAKFEAKLRAEEISFTTQYYFAGVNADPARNTSSHETLKFLENDFIRNHYDEILNITEVAYFGHEGTVLRNNIIVFLYCNEAVPIQTLPFILHLPVLSISPLPSHSPFSPNASPFISPPPTAFPSPPLQKYSACISRYGRRQQRQSR